MRIIKLGRVLFAVATASLAIWSICYAGLASQSLPSWIPWGEEWVYAYAAALLLVSVGLCFSRTALWSVSTIGALRAIAAALSVPHIVSRPLSIDAWYPCCEALTSVVGAWILYALLRRESPVSGARVARVLSSEHAVRGAQILFGLTCVFYGWSHFVYAAYTASMVPTWLPSRLMLAYFTGSCHVLAGLAIAVGILPRLAAALEALMMTLFGVLVWIPSFFVQPTPAWATPPSNRWSELIVTLVLAASAWIVTISLANRPWLFGSHSRVRALAG